jgi:hypothetical protein
VADFSALLVNPERERGGEAHDTPSLPLGVHQKGGWACGSPDQLARPHSQEDKIGYHHGTPFGGRAMPKLVRHADWIVAGMIVAVLGIGLTVAVRKVRDSASHMADT